MVEGAPKDEPLVANLMLFLPASKIPGFELDEDAPYAEVCTQYWSDMLEVLTV